MGRLGIVGLSVMLLVGCDNHQSSRDATQDAQLGRIESDIAELRALVRSIKEDAEKDRAFLVDTYNSQESIRRTFNHNAQVSNENSVKDMTRRGACGQVWQQSTDGQWFQANKPCTVADLKK